MKLIILIFCNTNYIVYESLGWTYLDWEGAYPTECFPVRGGMFSWSEQQPTSLSVYYSLKGRKVSIMGSQDLSQRYSSYCSDSWEHGAYGLSPPCPVYTNLTESYGRCGPLPLNQPKGSSGYIIFLKKFLSLNEFFTTHSGQNWLSLWAQSDKCERSGLWNETPLYGNDRVGPATVHKVNS